MSKLGWLWDNHWHPLVVTLNTLVTTLQNRVATLHVLVVTMQILAVTLNTLVITLQTLVANLPTLASRGAGREVESGRWPDGGRGQGRGAVTGVRLCQPVSRQLKESGRKE